METVEKVPTMEMMGISCNRWENQQNLHRLENQVPYENI